MKTKKQTFVFKLETNELKQKIKKFQGNVVKIKSGGGEETCEGAKKHGCCCKRII